MKKIENKPAVSEVKSHMRAVDCGYFAELAKKLTDLKENVKKRQLELTTIENNISSRLKSACTDIDHVESSLYNLTEKLRVIVDELRGRLS